MLTGPFSQIKKQKTTTTTTTKKQNNSKNNNKTKTGVNIVNAMTLHAFLCEVWPEIQFQLLFRASRVGGYLREQTTRHLTCQEDRQLSASITGCSYLVSPLLEAHTCIEV